MTLRIIDNKRVDLTDTEFKLYQELVKAYTTPTQSGEEFFKDLFETDKNGFIIFLKPPSKTYTSMECYFFLINIMIHQNVGNACDYSVKTTEECRKVISEARELITEMKKVLSK